MSGDADDWAEVMRTVAAIIDERPDEYTPTVRQGLEDLLLLLRSTNRPAPSYRRDTGQRSA